MQEIDNALAKNITLGRWYPPQKGISLIVEPVTAFHTIWPTITGT